MKKNAIVIAGGGTGGHIYPGLSLVEYLKKENPDLEVHFVGAEGGLEEKIVPKHGYPLHLLKVGRLHKSVSLVRRLKALFTLPLSFIQSLILFLKIRPKWVLGIGGFASGPFVFTASLMGAKTAILEPNAYPGMANRYLSKVVKFCFVVFQETTQYFPRKKVRQVGLPVRVQKKRPEFTYNGQRPFRILVTGGSQGARAVNNLVGDWVESLGDASKNYEIFHQVGARDHQVWLDRYKNKHDGFLTYSDYIHDMPEKLDWADLVICRSGVGSVVEVAMSGKVAIFIPLPTAADNHQVKNAQVLVERESGLMAEQKDLTGEKLGAMIETLRSEPARLKKMMGHLQSFDYTDAPKQIADNFIRETNGN